MTLKLTFIALIFLFTCNLLIGQNCKTEIDQQLEEAKAEIPGNMTLSVSLSQDAAKESKSCNYPEGESNANKQIGTVYFYLGKFDSTKKYWNKSREIALSIGGRILADINNNMGVLYQKIGSLDTSLYFHYKALSVRTTEQDTLGIASSYFNLASIHKSMGAFSKSLDFYLKAIDFYEQLQLNDKIAETNNSIGLVYLAIEDYNKALEYLELALKQKKEGNNERSLASTLSNLASVHMKMKNHTKAESYYLQAAKIYEKINDVHNLTGISANLGILYKELGDHENAIKYYKKAEEQMRLSGDKGGLSTVQMNLGAIYFLRDNFENAKKYYQNALKLAVENNNLTLQMTANQGLSRAHQELGNYKEAMTHNIRYVELNDSIFKQSVAEKMAELSEEYEAEKRLREISELEAESLIQEKSNQRKRFIIWLISIVGIGFIVLLLLQLNRIRLKRKFLEVQKQRVELDNQLKSKELDTKNRELTSYATNSLHTSEFLQDLKVKMDNVNFNEKDPAVLINELKKEIDDNLESEDQWEKFKIHFEGVHPNFFEKLSQQVSSLTTNDLKNCAYIRMNLSIKEVALLMNITPKSAKMNRYRLKKKIGLTETESLTDFIQNI